MGKMKQKIKRILIVEDDRDMQAIYGMIFNAHKDEYAVDYKTNPEKGLYLSKIKEYDLFIVDMIMEPIDGRLVVKEIRENEGTKKTPVLVVTVLNPNTLQELKELDHIDFLQKPYSFPIFRIHS